MEGKKIILFHHTLQLDPKVLHYTLSENLIKLRLEAVAGMGFNFYHNSGTWKSIMERHCTRAVAGG